MINKNKIIVAIGLLWAIIVISPVHLLSQNAATINSVTVMIEKFTLSGNTDNQNYIGDMSVFIQRSLQKYPTIKIVEDDSIHSSDNVKLNPDKQKGNNLTKKAGYIISGNYNISGNKITVYADVNKQDGGAIKNTICTGEMDKIDAFRDDIGRQISSVIFELEGISQKNIAIIYHLNKENTNDNDKLVYASQLTREIIFSFPAVENINLMNWKDEADFRGKTEEEIMNNLKVDGYFDLAFNFKKENFYSLSPRFVLNSKAGQKVQAIDLSNYATDYYKMVKYSTFVTNELSGFLNSLYNLNKGDVRPFLISSVKGDALLTLADSSSVKGDFHKSNYFLYCLMDQNPDMKAPKFIDIHNRLGKNKLNQNRTDEAEEEFNKVLSTDPGNHDAIIKLAAMKLEKNDYKGVLDQIVPLSQSDEVNLLKGQAYYGLGLYTEARTYLEMVTKPGKEDQYTKSVILGAVYLELNDRDKAMLEYRNLYMSNPNSEDIKYLYGYLLTLQGIDEYNNKSYKRAIDLLTNAQKIYKSQDATDYLRKSYIYDGRYNDALDLIEREIKTGGYNINYIYLTHALDVRQIFIALIPVDTAMGGQLIALLDKHIRFNPNDPLGYYYKGNTLTRLGHGPEGLAQMELSYDLDKANIPSQLDLLELYLLNNKFADCEKFYYRINKLNTSSKESKVTDRDMAIMYYLLISSLEIQGKDYSKYMGMLNNLFDKNTDINLWDYNSYLSWLENSGLDQEKKAFLKDLTKQMSLHDETTKNKIAEKEKQKQ